MQWVSPFGDGTFSWPGLNMVSNYIHIEAGIARMRSLLPKLRISPRCGGFVDEVSRYRRPKETERSNWDVKPIDSHNHSIKAFIYWAIAKYGLVTVSGDKSPWRDFSVG
jgi:hypothetical protein